MGARGMGGFGVGGGGYGLELNRKSKDMKQANANIIDCLPVSIRL